MIITYTTDEARRIAAEFNRQDVYVANSHANILVQFKNNGRKCLVVCGRLLEGFNQRSVSVVGIHRNIQLQSRVLFTQFVGRAVRTICPGQRDVIAEVVAHQDFHQLQNFELLDRLAEVDPQPDQLAP